MHEPDDSHIILFSPYAIQHTGILCDRCRLVISNYTLACAPYQLSKTNAVILLSFDQREYTFFSKFKKKLCFLSFCFQNMYPQNSDEILMHSEILKVMPLKEKQSIYLFTLGLAYCPADLSFIIDNYFRDY